MTTREVDVVVVGLGPGGEYAAQKLAEAGLDVVGVERGLVGGECPFYGCIPSKMMIRASDLLAEARRAPELAGDVDVRPDWERVATRIRKQATADWSDDSHAERLQEAGVEIVRGHGRLDGPGRVVVDDDVYVAARGVVLNPGTSPAELPIDGLADTPYWTNREVVRLEELPGSLVVIGGGAIGCELAQVFSRFGVDVQRGRARRSPPGAGGARDERPDRPRVRATKALASTPEPRSSASTTTGSSGSGWRIGSCGPTSSSWPPAATTTSTTWVWRRSASTRAARSLDTDERLRAGERLWAVGDVTAKGAFTHVSMYQAAVVVRDILGEDGPWADYHAVSRVTFTDPEVGSVGITEKQARERGLTVAVGHAELPESSRGWIHQAGNDGLIKLVADAERGVLVGGTAVGPSGGEVLGLLAAAVHAEVPISTLRGMHFAYPTFHRAIEVALAELG